MTIQADALPLKMDEHGMIRVAGTRVTLDTLLSYYNRGQSAEELADAFPTVPLADVHTVIGYYLRHRPEVDAYLESNRQASDELRRTIEASQPPRPSKAELLARWEKKYGAPFPHRADEGTGT